MVRTDDSKGGQEHKWVITSLCNFHFNVINIESIIHSGTNNLNGKEMGY